MDSKCLVANLLTDCFDVEVFMECVVGYVPGCRNEKTEGWLIGRFCTYGKNMIYLYLGPIKK